MALLEIAQRVRGLIKGVGFLHNRHHLAFRHQITKELQVRSVRLGDIALKFLVHKAGSPCSREVPSDPPQLSLVQSCAANPCEDADAAGLQEVAPFGKGMIVDVIEDQVVALLALGEVFFGVVDDVISAERCAISMLRVLHTAVTSVSNAFAI